MSATAIRSGLLLCQACYFLNRARPSPHSLACARCGAAIYGRKPASLSRGWAFLITACIFYVPANTFPVIESGKLFETQADTIMSGAVYLWHTGSWVLAIIVFLASIVVPGAKLASLAFLFWTAGRRSTWCPEERTRLYRLTEYVGRWSMVDIYVGAMLVALVQLQPFATVEPGPGAIAFCAVVVFTMLASASFDPRLTWDPVDDHE